MSHDVLLNVTDLCNARCVMCNMWRNRDEGNSFLPPELLRTVRPVSSISIAGGEPFLHRRIVEIAEAIHQENPRAKMIFSTNGFSTRRIAADVERILAFHANTQVTISLDGIGEIHDQMRGIPGAWNKVNSTFDRLREIGLKQCNFAFTITKDNFRSLPDVLAHAKEKGAGLSLAVAQSSRYLNVEVPSIDHEAIFPFVNPLIEDYLRSWNPADWARAFFVYGMMRHLATGRRPLVCDALDRQYMIDQVGNVYSCHPLMLPAGSLKESSLGEILTDNRIQNLRPKIKECHACWEVCTARSSIRAHLVRVGLWAVWNKVLTHLGLRDGRKASLLFPAVRGRGVENPESLSTDH